MGSRRGISINAVVHQYIYPFASGGAPSLFKKHNLLKLHMNFVIASYYVNWRFYLTKKLGVANYGVAILGWYVPFLGFHSFIFPNLSG